MFMAAAAEAAAQPEPGSEDGASSAGTERRGPGTWPGRPAPVHAGNGGTARPAPPRPPLTGRGQRLGPPASSSVHIYMCIYICISEYILFVYFICVLL